MSHLKDIVFSPKGFREKDPDCVGIREHEDCGGTHAQNAIHNET